MNASTTTTAVAATGTPPAAPARYVFPPSYAQRRLWFIHQLEPESPTYNVPLFLRLAGALDRDALERSVAELVRRHESLRTTFPVREGEPVQQVHAPGAFTLPVDDLGALAEPQRSERARALRAAEAAQAFDLESAPPARFRLVRLDEREHELLITLHHIVSDGWSRGVLARELGAIYDALRRGAPSPLPPPAIQHADYSVWQREWLQGSVFEQQLAYWSKRLADVPSLDVPTDYARTASTRRPGATVAFELSAELGARVQELGRAEGATAFMVLLAAFQWLLGRYADQDDVAVGTAIANRRRRETENLVGFLVNTLVMRADLGGDPSFRELVGRTRRLALEAYAHQDLPFERLVEALNPPRVLGRTPLFQAMFSVESGRGPLWELPGLHVEEIEGGDVEQAKFDLMLILQQSPSGLRGELQYAADLYRRDSMTRLADHYGRLLEAALAAPDAPLSSLSLLSEDDARSLAQWNRSARDYPGERGVHELFEDRAAAHPLATAVTHGLERLTYADLDQRASRLAQALRARGVGPESRVGLCLERGLDLVVGLLAVLKAGGAYVPLDPSYPVERLAHMLADARAGLVLTQGPLRALFHDAAVDLLEVDTAATPSDGPLPESPRVQGAGDALAYVMYTSGSTGVPKGIMVPHRAVARLVLNTDYVDLGPGDRVAQVSNASFDAATFEIWGALLNGATLVIVDKEIALSPPELAQALARERIDVAFLTTALFNQTAREAPGAFRGLRCLLFGGEMADAREVRGVLDDGGPRRLLHVYGPTETTTFATWFHVRALEPRQQAVPIGAPIANTRAYVLDRALRPLPPDLPGELYLGGPGVARGYWARPELTAERFVPDPFGGEAGARLYRTGDKARRRSDGRLEFLGRFDEQIKLRGFRIEIGEIEAALKRHEAVEDAVVVLRDDGDDRRLVGYLVGRPGTTLRAGEVRDELRRRLPDYMLPAALVVLQALPLNANGKVDRRALPAPARDEHATREYVAPRSELEAALCRLWAETLRLDRVGVNDNFFDVGGHSLLATRVTSRVRGELGLDLPLRALFECPTVAELALRLEAPRPPEAEPSAALVPVPRDGLLPLSPAQRRLWFLQQLEPGSGAYNVAFFLRLHGDLDPAALEWSWSEIVRRHEVLRTSFPARRGEPRQEIQPAHPVVLPLVDLALVEPEQQARLARDLRQQAADRPFDLAQAPLWRAHLLRLGEGEHELLLTMHHVVTDGWSEGILVTELKALYAARRAGQPSPLPELPVQYADFAAWQQGWLQGEALARQVEYWRGQLAGVALLDLPTDGPRLPVASHPQQSRPLRLAAGLAQALQRLGQHEGATLFMTLLAGFQWLLSRYTRQDDVAVGTVIANRNRHEIEGLVGFFVNTLVLRGNTSGAPTFRGLVRQARDTALAAYEHQDVPFEKLVEELNPDRDLGRTPFFQALLVLQNAPAGAWELPGLRVEDQAVELHDAKFELNLTLVQTGEGLEGRLSYAADLFEAATVDQFLGHYVGLLEQAVARPDAALPTLPLLRDDERRRVVEDWNRTDKPWPGAASITELLAGRARREPDAIAVIFEGTPLTCGELEQRANRLARHLAQRGVGRETRVGLCLERGTEWVVAIVAVWKAGGVYVPLDPAYPRERLEFMLRDAEVGVLLTDQALLDELPPHPCVVCLDLDWEAIEAQDAANADVPLQPESLAYVMYTSGSTGKPKGVMIEQRGMLNHLWAKIDDLGLDARDVVAQNAPASFDISIWQLLAVLLVDGQVQIFGDEVSRDPALIVTEAEQAGVTVLETVPSLLAMMVEQDERAAAQQPRLERLRCLISNAEALPVALGERWLAQRPRVRLLNTYGATECSDDVTHHVLAPGASRRGAAYAPLGVPLANLTTYVLDADLRPVPFGVPGELYLGGIGVGRGYLNRPSLTAERFVPDPFARVPGRRLYRTGDLGRLNRDRSLEFLGRVDFQVKVRGHRVELGEIEDALLEHDGVSQAVVLLREDTPGDQRLAAYVVAGGGADAETLPARLVTFLAERLPDYMVPAAYVLLEALPLTVNGKVDRRALPPPEGAVAAPDAFVAPRNEIETVLCGLWAQLLRVPRVGVHDNFFGLGGHSLLATQVIARVRNVLQVEVPLAAIFRSPTVAGFAQELERAREAKETPRIVAADRAGFRRA